MSSRHTRFVPRVEGLEDRTVPAGNVQVMVGDGILYVAGDDNDNAFWIAGAGKNSVVIRSTDGTTTINGQLGPVFVGGIKNGYYVRTHGGNDNVLITGTRSNGQLDVDAGDGDDILGISNAGHKKETVLNLGNGNDTLILHGSAFRKAVFVNVGAGEDQVTASGIGVMDLYMINPAGGGFFDNQGSTIGRPNLIGFTLGQRPELPASPPNPPTPDVDTTAPTATLSTAATDPTNASPITFAVNFSEPVTGFGAAGLQVTNGAVTSFTQLDAQTYSFQVTPNGPGTVSATVVAGAATDAAGNASTASDTVSRIFDNVAPVVTITPRVTNSSTPTITGTVDDPTATVRVTVNGQVLTAVVTGTTWAATVTTPLSDGTYSVTATATDPAGNSDSDTLATGLTVDTNPPEVAQFIPDSGQTTNASTINFTIVFSEDMIGFTAADIDVGNVTNGGNLNFQQIDPRTYTIVLMPDLDGPVNVVIDPSVATDAAGNPNAAASYTITYDTTDPTGTINPTGQTAITGTAADSLAGVQAVAVSVFNGTLYYTGPSNGFDSPTEVFLPAATSDNFATWSFAMPINGTFTVNARITDNATNDVTVSQSVTIDNTPPVLTIDDPPATSGAVTGTATDATTTVASVQVSVFDGTNYLNAAGTAFDSLTEVFLTPDTSNDFATWSVAVPAAGTYDVKAIATDDLNNQATATKLDLVIS